MTHICYFSEYSQDIILHPTNTDNEKKKHKYTSAI